MAETFESPKSTPVPLLDIQRNNALLLPEIQQAIQAVCESGQFIFGPECVKLEETIARLCHARHGVGCASGSDALLLALMAIDIGPGDEVIVPSFTFFATASAVWRLGARPVFADIDPVTFNLDPRRVAAAATRATKAVIPVHLFGQCAEMDAINALAKKHHWTVIEDAAQAIGATYHGRPAGSIGEMGCFSFYPTKNLGGFGDGGMLTTSSQELADKLRLLRGHGMQPRYYHQSVGINSRLDTIQAAALCVKIKLLQDWSARRRENADRYTQWFNEAGLSDIITLPQTATGQGHVWNQYTIRVSEGRDALREHLSKANIGTEIYYPVPLHQQACFQGLGVAEGSLPETERAAKEALSLPIFPELTEREQLAVVDGIKGFFQAFRHRSHAA